MLVLASPEIGHLAPGFGSRKNSLSLRAFGPLAAIVAIGCAVCSRTREAYCALFFIIVFELRALLPRNAVNYGIAVTPSGGQDLRVIAASLGAEKRLHRKLEPLHETRTGGDHPLQLTRSHDSPEFR